VTGFEGNDGPEAGGDEAIGLLSSPHEPLPGKKAIDPIGDAGPLPANPPSTPSRYCPILPGYGPPW
jgi:hypothetical protein